MVRIVYCIFLFFIELSRFNNLNHEVKMLTRVKLNCFIYIYIFFILLLSVFIIFFIYKYFFLHVIIFFFLKNSIHLLILLFFII